MSENEWPIEVRCVDVLQALNQRLCEFQAEYGLRDNQVCAVALGPNEYCSFRLQVMQKARSWDGIVRLSDPAILEWRGRKVFCMSRPGIELLVTDAWRVQVEEVRKHIPAGKLDA